MSKRNVIFYLDDILDSSGAIKSFVGEMSFDEFCHDRKTFSATIREFIVIGEAIGRVIDVLKQHSPEYDWQLIKDFRNLIVHEYFGVDERIIWDAVHLELNEVEVRIQALKEDL